MSAGRGPLPQWNMVGDHSTGIYEAVDPHGTIWRLWLVEEPCPADPHPPGYRLTPRGGRAAPTFITSEHGLYHAMDMAGMQIAASAVKADPDGAARQLGLGED